jgi:hypothetical protein
MPYKAEGLARPAVAVDLSRLCSLTVVLSDYGLVSPITQPNASCDHSVKQERTIATRIGLGHNTFPTPPRESNNYFAEDEVITGTIDSEETRSPRWRLSIQTLARTHNLESVIHAVERLTSERRDKSESLIPIRFINTHKVHIANRFAD